MKNKNAWRWWAKALGEKASKCDHESDRIAIIRTFIFIIAGVIRHWNKNEVPSCVFKTEEERILKANSNLL